VSMEQQRIRVLIADDDALLRDIAIATFEGAGFEVQAVTTGNAAVAAEALVETLLERGREGDLAEAGRHRSDEKSAR